MLMLKLVFCLKLAIFRPQYQQSALADVNDPPVLAHFTSIRRLNSEFLPGCYAADIGQCVCQRKS